MDVHSIHSPVYTVHLLLDTADFPIDKVHLLLDTVDILLQLVFDSLEAHISSETE